MAVAGFNQSNLSIETQENTLLIEGKTTKADENRAATTRYLHKGISARNFKRKFQLGDYVKVQAAEIQNGMLHVELKRELPEAKQPRQIPIGNS